MDRTRSIELLNKAIGDEMSAAHQYMYFHFQLDDQGFGPLAGLFRRTAVEEMVHIEQLAERILFLKGEVELKASEDVKKINEPQEILKKACGMEQQAIVDYNNFALECAQNADAASRQMFEALIADEERHYAEFDLQLDNVERFGLRYLALQSFQGGEGEA